MVIITKKSEDSNGALFDILKEYEDIEDAYEGLSEYLSMIGEKEALERVEWVENGVLRTVISTGQIIFSEEE